MARPVQALSCDVGYGLQMGKQAARRGAVCWACPLNEPSPLQPDDWGVKTTLPSGSCTWKAPAPTPTSWTPLHKGESLLGSLRHRFLGHLLCGGPRPGPYRRKGLVVPGA